MTPKQLSARLAKLRARIEENGAVAIVKAAEVIKHSAQHEWIGNEHDSWEPLKDSTIERKQRGGYEVPNPLVRTEQLRNSIEIRAEGLHAFIGSDDPVAVIQEHGTLDKNGFVPPRPFMSSAAMSSAPKVKAILENAIAKSLKQTFK